MAAFLPSTPVWEARQFLAREALAPESGHRDAGESNVYSTREFTSAMAMGSGIADDNGRVAHSTADRTRSAWSAAAAQNEYLCRMGSRSLTEEQSRASTHSNGSTSSIDGAKQRNSLPERTSPVKHEHVNSTMVRHGSDPHLNDRYYASLLEMGNYIKMGWLTKQGHVWKNWKNRFFVLFHDGTLAYYKTKGKRRMKGCMKLNEGVVSVQHVDIRRSSKPYVFQIEKGFYRMWCYCSSQLEAELWVNALRDVRDFSPPCFEPLLTIHEEQFGHLAINRNLNKIFVVDERIQSMLASFKSSIVPRTIVITYDFIERLEDLIMNRYLGKLYSDPEVQLIAGNELITLLRRYVEDRAFIPVATEVYSILTTSTRLARSRITKSLKALKGRTQRDLGVPDDIAELSTDWADTQAVANTMDCMSLPSHKIDMIIHAASSIVGRITEHLGAQTDVPDQTLSAIFRFVLVHSTIEDLAVLRAVLAPIYSAHPACLNQSNTVAAFVDAIAWIEGYQQATDDTNAPMDCVSLASSRATVSISTPEVGILFTTDGNGRGAIVHTVRKLSQAALSEVIVPGLSLIAINDEPVILMPFRDICERLRTAALPKKLTFMPEFFYYQLLSLDSDLYQYLLCLGASRGDKDSVAWLVGSQVDVNEPSTWERTRGAQLLGCKPPDVGNIALHAAARNGHRVMVDYLLRLGATPTQADRLGRTPLHMLSTRSLDMVSIIEMLKDAGAKLDATDRDGVTPLMEMARRESLEGVTTLLALGANLNAIAWSTGYTALECAVSVGAIDVVELLLSNHANPNHATLDGDTSLHIAAGHANTAIVQLLITAGADVNHQNRFSQTPAAVMLAQGADRPSSVKACLALFAKAGCELGKPDLLGRHLLHLAQLSNDDTICESLRQLFTTTESGDQEVVDMFGCTAQDYSFDRRVGSMLSHFHLRDPRHMWASATSTHTIARSNSSSRCGPSSRRPQGATRSNSKSFDDLMQGLLHDVSVDLADLVAFTMFHETFASLDAVMAHLQGCVSNGSHGRNLLRFVVVLLLFKIRHTHGNGNDKMLTQIHTLLDRHRRIMAHKAVVLVDEYKKMFERLFSLRASPYGAAEYYASIPMTMQQLYGLDKVHSFATAFPRNLFIQVEPSEWAEHCTLVTHALFCSIPVEDFLSASSKAPPSRQFLSAKRWFQHLTAYVINSVLVEDTREGRAHVIGFFLSAADCCLSLRNYDTLAAILYALQSTAVQRLRRTMDGLSVDSKKLLNQMQGLSDKGCREVNKIMHAAANPSDLVNGNRLRKMGELVVEILRRRSVAYELPFRNDVDILLHVELPYATDESRYTRSLQLEPREAGAAPLGDRTTLMVDDYDNDIDSEVRESIGSEGTFGIRQWFRMQKVVHRHRSRSATQPASYEWV